MRVKAKKISLETDFAALFLLFVVLDFRRSQIPAYSRDPTLDIASSSPRVFPDSKDNSQRFQTERRRPRWP